MAETPGPTARNSIGTQLHGPAGGAIWNTPTIDVGRNALYVGTGNNFAPPATDLSDSLLALDLDTGEVRWSHQVTANDIWNGSCRRPDREAAVWPDKDAPDFDFTGSSLLVDVGNGRQLVVVGNKSGIIFGFDPDAVQKRVTALPWVRHATVERRLPDTVRIRIAERRPAALWQRQGQLSLIDEDGTVITTRGLGRFRDLIIIVGNDAPKHVPTLVALLRSEPALGRRVSAAVRVGGRRWNVKLRNSIAVWLPEDDPLGAWRRLAELNLRHRILERDIKVIDLRLPDRMVVRPGKKRRAVISKVGGKRT